MSDTEESEDDMVQRIGQEYSEMLDVVASILGDRDTAASFVAVLASKGYLIEKHHE